jgi:predicted ribosomally synthesized peptide with nif11-like leader
MSLDSAKKFLGRLKDDVAFRHSLEVAKTDEARKVIVEEAGFDFSKDELKKAAAREGEVAPRSSAQWTSTSASAASSASAAAAAL